MRFLGRTERRVVVAILITALVPLLGAVLTSRAIIRRVSATAFQPEFGALMDQSLGVYADLVKSIKQSMRFEADAIAAEKKLVEAARSADKRATEAALAEVFASYPDLVSLRVESANGDEIAEKNREKPLDEGSERSLVQRRSLAAQEGDEGPLLVITFATPRARFNELEGAQALVQAYHQIERNQREEYLDTTYQRAFAVLIFLTIAAGVGAGLGVARPVTRRIARLGQAMRPVAEGDLEVRVREEGNDEVTDLARAFNRMLSELSTSRARIEYLRLMGEWQKVARRLAHEIKNPLQPIQLAVEECHRRYRGDDEAYRSVLETTLEVVTEEVGSLRRLVGEFSSFARLPKAEPVELDLAELVRDQEQHFALASSSDGGEEAALWANVTLSFDVGPGPMPALVDREMLHRAIVNVVRNAAQALRDAGRKEPGHIEVSLRKEAKGYVLWVDDDGPGIDPKLGATLFDPYVTTKRDGTGLGLSIVKKIIVDHGGTIEAKASPMGGARFEIRLPKPIVAHAA